MNRPSYPHSHLKKAVHVLLVLAMVFSMTSIAFAADVPPSVVTETASFNRAQPVPVVVGLDPGEGLLAASSISAVYYSSQLLTLGQDYTYGFDDPQLTINISFLMNFETGQAVPITVYFEDQQSTIDTFEISIADFMLPSIYDAQGVSYDLAMGGTMTVEYFTGSGTEQATAVSSIELNSNTLQADTEFFYDGPGSFTLAEGFLTSLPVGQSDLLVTFDNPAATTATLTIDVTDSNNQPPSLNAHAYFVSEAPADLQVAVNYGTGDGSADGILSVSNGTQVLTEGLDYSLSNNILTIKQAYLQAQAVPSTQVLTVVFNDPAETEGSLSIEILRTAGAINESTDALGSVQVPNATGYGQSFVPATTGRLQQISLKIAPQATDFPFDLRLYLYSWDSGSNQPTEVIGFSEIVSMSSSNTLDDWTSFHFSEPVELSSWDAYAFMVDNVTGGNSENINEYVLAYNAQDTYADGVLLHGVFSAPEIGMFTFEADPASDLQFKVELFQNVDSDGDGVLDPDDNAPYVYNPMQEDRDGDGIGDVIDPDSPPFLLQESLEYDKASGTGIDLAYDAGLGAEIADGIAAVFLEVPGGYEPINASLYLDDPATTRLHLTPELLQQQPNGETVFLIVFQNSQRTECSVSIQITDTGNVAPILNAYRLFNTNDPADLQIPVDLGLGDLIATDIEAIFLLDQPLSRGSDYDFSGTTLTLYSNYLAAFGLATITLDVVFNDTSGTHGQVVVKIGNWNGPRNDSPEGLTAFTVSDIEYPSVIAGQSFIPQTTGYLNTIGVKVSNANAQIPVQLRIQVWSADWVTDVPENWRAESSIVQIDSSTDINDWTWFAFNSPVTLYENQKYALLIDNLYGLGINFSYDLSVSFNNVDVYPDGCLIAGEELNSYDPLFYPYSDMDLQFAVNLTGSGDPEPDLDGDGIPDTSDPDVDGDGLSNDYEGDYDVDGDGLPNYRDTDSDGDGIPDAEDPTPFGTDNPDWDYDGDGIPNEFDNAPYNYNPGQEDTDGDGIADVIDPTPNGEPEIIDTDGDLVPDDIDNAPYLFNPDQSDLDGDGIGDVADYDADNDGVPNNLDNAPWVANPDQSDIDRDGIGDVVDEDDDNDGVPDADDNAQFFYNPDQMDADKDGIGDVVDSDDDNDGVADVADNAQFDFNPDQSDLDGDGLGDVIDPDLDGDGILNGDDNAPRNANPDQADLDWDRIGDVIDPDLDGDGVQNVNDNAPKIYNPGQEDLDNDHYGDVIDNDILNVISPANATITGTVIQATVAKTAKSVSILVTVSPNATWNAYYDAACAMPVESLLVSLGSTAKTIFIKVFSCEGRSQLYTMTISKGTTNTNKPGRK